MFFGPIFIMGLTALVSGYGLTRSSFNNPELSPTLAGVDQNKLVAALGAGAALLLSGPLSLIGAGLAVGSLLAETSRTQAKAGLDQLVMAQAQAQAQAQLPGPTAPAAPMAPEPSRRPGLLDALSQFWQPQNA